MKETVEQQKNLTVAQREAKSFIVENGEVVGVLTNYDEKIYARSVILTAGTFMKSVMHTGFRQMEGGRSGDTSANAISDSLRSLGFTLVRLKTGTPARLAFTSPGAEEEEETTRTILFSSMVSNKA